MSVEAHFGRVTLLRLFGGGAIGMGTAHAGTLVRFTAWGDSIVPGRVVEFTGETATSRTPALEKSKLDALAPLLATFCTIGRALEVSSVVDTSDVWTQLTLEVDWKGAHNCLHLTMMASGFEGSDAPLVDRILRGIEELVGLAGGSLS